jgi:hypothetical protein
VHGITLAQVRAADPDGGPQWGLGLFDAAPSAPPPPVPANLASQFDRPTTCVVIGRVQDGALGVVGRDGIFRDDGRFHRLTPGPQASIACAGRAQDGSFVSLFKMPPIPASGYTGPPGTRIGGCRERVSLDGPTVSPQTRRRLRGVPPCSRGSLRDVIAGFAGPHAVKATLNGRSLRLRPQDNGAFLFVLQTADAQQTQLRITDRDGTVCSPFAGNQCQNLWASRP